MSDASPQVTANFPLGEPVTQRLNAPPRSTTTTLPSPPLPSSSGPSSGSASVVSPSRGAVRQRRRLPLTLVATHLHRPRHPAQAHEAVSATDQREDRAVPPHPGRRLGLRPLLYERGRAPRETRGLAALRQPPPPPRSLREPATLLTSDQRLRSVHLDPTQFAASEEAPARGGLEGEAPTAAGNGVDY